MNCIIETKWYITTNVQQQLRWATVQSESKSGVAAVPLSVEGESNTTSRVPLSSRLHGHNRHGPKMGAAVPPCLGELGPI